jgi:hypothetical protein
MLVAVVSTPGRILYWRWRRVRERPTVAMIACMQCMHKLLAGVYGVAKNGRPFQAQIAATWRRSLARRLSIMKAVLSGRGSELVELEKTNIFR